MKYRGVVMVPQLIEFESAGNNSNVHNQAIGMLESYPVVIIGEQTYEAKIMGIYPAKGDKSQPLVFDPPPMAA